ncbi:protein ROLLING AND ERECT LEAF 2 [Oryza brachyantha]|uniref:protein ROLLING AND ERECT LEAF 2 n=1 Tax=Oryza brachyantha TaxID=4533 RepID=UPI001AD95F9E|nr:protein ROLLING AND ERECT LEAF 2 [Oryza brachyantha]
MGCTVSKVEQEDTVRRCKERRRHMKDAVASRQLLASAHADYLRSLRLTAAALSRFAQGHPSLAVSHHTAPVLLTTAPPPPPAPAHAHAHAAALAPAMTPPAPPSTASSSLPPPAPMLPKHPPPPPQPQPQPPAPVAVRAPRAAQRHFKVPHILSDSSVGIASPAQSSFRKPVVGTPSSSSAWDWENFYPPSPPDSEFFDRRKADLEEANRLRELEEEEKARRYLHHDHPDHLKEEDEDDEDDDHEREEEMHCGGWEDDDDHYASTTTSETRSEEGEMGNRSECGFAARSEYGGTAPSEYAAVPLPLRRRDERSEAGDSSSTVTAAAEMRMVIRHRTLAEIVAAIEEYFVKAAEAGNGVSELLEASRAQLDRNFRQLKKTVYHSNSLLSSLSSTWSSKPPLAVRYKLDTNALEMESMEGKSHGSTLERLLAWEKKLYQEVKARESVKIEHEKKLSTLQSLEYRGKDSAKLDKTKASINKLQSLIIVTSQAATTTSSAIVRVRDNELAPQLVELCFALLSMWRSMNHFHEIQNEIVQQVRGLVDNSMAESTSDLHRLATRDLEAAVSAWHSNFNRLIKYQREYIRALYGWLKLTLFQVDSNTPQEAYTSLISRELTSFCDEWKQALDRLPDAVASEAIKSFVNVVHVIYTKQAEEMKIKKRAETYSKELEKKTNSLRAIEKKYYQSYSMVGLGLPGSGRDGIESHSFDARDPLAEKKTEITLCRRKVEDEMTRHSKAVEVTRSMTLNNIQTGLPGMFQAIAGFSGTVVEALDVVCRRAGSVR